MCSLTHRVFAVGGVLASVFIASAAAQEATPIPAAQSMAVTGEWLKGGGEKARTWVADIDAQGDTFSGVVKIDPAPGYLTVRGERSGSAVEFEMSRNDLVVGTFSGSVGADGVLAGTYSFIDGSSGEWSGRWDTVPESSE